MLDSSRKVCGGDFNQSVLSVAIGEVAEVKAKLETAAADLFPGNPNRQHNYIIEGVRKLSGLDEFVPLLREKMQLFLLNAKVKEVTRSITHSSKTDVYRALGIPESLFTPDVSAIHGDLSAAEIQQCSHEAVRRVLNLPKMEQVRLALDTPFTEWNYKEHREQIHDVYGSAQLPPEAIMAAVQGDETAMQQYIKGGLFIRTADEMHEEWEDDTQKTEGRLRFFGLKTQDKRGLCIASVYEERPRGKSEFMMYGPGTHMEYSPSATAERTRLTEKITRTPASVDMFDTIAVRLNKEGTGENPILAVLTMLEFAVMRLKEDPNRTEMILYVMNLLHIDFCPDVRKPDKVTEYPVRGLENSRSLRFFLGLGAIDFGLSTSMIDHRTAKNIQKPDTRSTRRGTHVVTSAGGLSEEVQWEARLSPVWRLMSIKYNTLVKNLWYELEKRTAAYGYLNHPRMESLRERIAALKL